MHIGQNWKRIFLEYQIFLIDKNNIIGYGNCIPFYLGYSLFLLPQKGLDWLLRKCLKDLKSNKKANFLAGFQIVIRKKYQGQSYSKFIKEKIKKIGRSKGLKKLIVPVRPILKKNFPLISMKKYIKVMNEKNEIYDPWLRTHVSLGAKIIKPCNKSMTIKGSINDFEKWTGKKFISNGKYITENTTSPLVINLSKNLGVYHDENVWIYYNL